MNFLIDHFLTIFCGGLAVAFFWLTYSAARTGCQASVVFELSFLAAASIVAAVFREI